MIKWEKCALRHVIMAAIITITIRGIMITHSASPTTNCIHDALMVIRVQMPSWSTTLPTVNSLKSKLHNKH